MKYCQSSVVPADDLQGHFTFSAFATGMAEWGKAWTVAWVVIRAAATTGSTSGIWYSQSSIGHQTTGIFLLPRGIVLQLEQPLVLSFTTSFYDGYPPRTN